MRLKRNDPGLKSLGLLNRGVGQGGLALIEEALSSNTVLATLDLSFNNICDRCGPVLHRLLARNQRILTLTLTLIA